MGRGFTSGEGTVCSGEGIPGWNGMRSVVGVCCRCPQHLGRVRAGGIQGEAAQAFGTQSRLAGSVFSVTGRGLASSISTSPLSAQGN